MREMLKVRCANILMCEIFDALKKIVGLTQ